MPPARLNFPGGLGANLVACGRIPRLRHLSAAPGRSNCYGDLRCVPGADTQSWEGHSGAYIWHAHGQMPHARLRPAPRYSAPLACATRI